MTPARLVHARAFHDGTVVCERVLVTVIASDERLGLTPRERRHITVRFVHGIEPEFRSRLMQLLRCRGARSRRIAETFDPIELEVDGQQRLAARIEAPAVRNLSLEQTDFKLRDGGGGLCEPCWPGPLIAP